ncbi:MAG: NAD-dependent epimerase/dehydratase family protein [Oxalobacteraceae bacterium]|nr:NAD-dependent epimerase/dehydratase family protein [Oxalobacteraceae bacterium]
MSFWQGKRVLITGANGFIGGNLTHYFVNEGAEVTGLERNIERRSYLHFEGLGSKMRTVRGDLCDRSFLERVMAEGNFEYCFHLAAQVEIGVGLQSPYTTFETNVRGTYTSTDKAYGEYPADQMPYREHYPLKPQYPYDTSKACADMIAHSYASDVYQLPLVVTRFCNIYGPGQLNFSALIPDSVRAAIGKGTFVPRGDGSHVRDFIYADDVVSLYARIAEVLSHEPARFRGKAYNAGTNEPRTVREVIQMVFNKCNNPAALTMIEEQMRSARTTGEITVQYMDYDGVQRDFGWKPTTSFSDGIDQTIAWFRRFLAD